MLVLAGPAIDASLGTALEEHAPEHGQTLALSAYSAKLYEWKLA
jgi:hypothetical protein